MLTAMMLEQLDSATKIQIKLWAKKPPRMKPLRIEWPGRPAEKAKAKAKPSTPSEVLQFMSKRRGVVEVIGGNDDGS